MYQVLVGLNKEDENSNKYAKLKVSNKLIGWLVKIYLRCTSFSYVSQLWKVNVLTHPNLPELGGKNTVFTNDFQNLTSKSDFILTKFPTGQNPFVDLPNSNNFSSWKLTSNGISNLEAWKSYMKER